MKYWLGLGSNLGDRLATLRAAAEALAARGKLRGRSRVYASSGMGGPPQPAFLNAAVLVESDLEPLAMLEVCHAVERENGRVREQESVRWGPRTLDVDILLIGGRGEKLVRLPGLIVPHPRLHERAFALAPLLDLDPRLLHPSSKRPLGELLAETHSKGHVVAATSDEL
jgi:2-amino-4-hydroxy-6-hydroxymethyldihydropteridine diphosphokinase